jgi:hypothetical protein
MRVAALLILILVLAGAWAASANARGTATHAVWVANANRACAWAGNKRRPLPPFDGSTTQLANVMPKIRAIQIVELRRIRSVPAAAGDRTLVAALVDYWTSDIAKERTAYVALKAHRYAAFNESYNRVLSLERSEDDLLRALGTACRQT